MSTDYLRSVRKQNRSEVDEKNQQQSATVVDNHRWYKSNAKFDHDHQSGGHMSNVSNHDRDLHFQGRQQRALHQG